MMTVVPFDVLTATATKLESLLSSGAVTSTQLVEVYLAESDKHNVYSKAVIATAPSTSLMEKAKTLDKERSSDPVRFNLHGLPTLVKVWPALISCSASDLQRQGQRGYSPRSEHGDQFWQLRLRRITSKEERGYD